MANPDQHVMAEARGLLIGALFAMAASVAGVTAAAYAVGQFAVWWVPLSAAALGPVWMMVILGTRTARPLLAWMFGFAVAGIVVGLCVGWMFRRLILCV